MNELTAWLRAQYDARERELDDDERVAKACHAPEWVEGCSWLADLRDPLPSQRRAYGLPKEWQLLTEADTKHIARQDPASVIERVRLERADIAAKRAILDEAARYSPEPEYGDNGLRVFETVVRLLAGNGGAR